MEEGGSPAVGEMYLTETFGQERVKTPHNWGTMPSIPMKHLSRAPAPLLLASVLCLCFGTKAHARETAAQIANRKALVTSYARIDGLVARKDVDGIMALIAPDFRLYASDGSSLDRVQYERLARISKGNAALKTSSQTTVTKVEWRGPDAIVYTDSRVQTRGPNGVLVVTGKTRDYWGAIKGRWQMRQSATLGGRVTLNGKTLLQR